MLLLVLAMRRARDHSARKLANRSLWASGELSRSCIHTGHVRKALGQFRAVVAHLDAPCFVFVGRRDVQLNSDVQVL